MVGKSGNKRNLCTDGLLYLDGVNDRVLVVLLEEALEENG